MVLPNSVKAFYAIDISIGVLQGSLLGPVLTKRVERQTFMNCQRSFAWSNKNNNFHIMLWHIVLGLISESLKVVTVTLILDVCLSISFSYWHNLHISYLLTCFSDVLVELTYSFFVKITRRFILELPIKEM